MSAPDKKREIRLKKELENLSRATTLAEIEKVLETLSEIGNRDTIEPIVRKYQGVSSEEIRKALQQFLFDIKTYEAVPELIRLMQEAKEPEIKKMLISVFWQSALPGDEYLSDFIKEAIAGDESVALEVLTVVSNFSAIYPESELLLLMQDLHDAMEREQSEYKRKLLHQLLDILKDFLVSIDKRDN